MFQRAVTLGSIRGVAVRIDPSWLIIAALISLSFWERFTVYGHPAVPAAAMALLAAMLFFASVLGHELAHAIEAQERDVEVSSITLFLFGGVTQMHVEARRPRDEFALAAVGPYASLVVSAVFGLIAAYVNLYGPAAGAPIADIAGLLGWINLGLALFNLIPGAPLDGGRVLRSALWALLGDRNRATRLAARAGQALAAAIFGYGAYLAFFVPGGVVNGLWLGFIGWFMLQAAGAEIAHAEVADLVRDRVVGELVHRPGPTVAPTDGLGAIDARFAAEGHQVLPVAIDGEVVGAVVMRDVAAIDPHDRTFRVARDVMRSVDDLTEIPADTPVLELLQRAESPELIRVTGADGDVLLTRDEVGAALERLHALERRGAG